nr:hypothetical protein [Tanacetum cinerariifolium]
MSIMRMRRLIYKSRISKWVLAIGDGTVMAKKKEGEDEATWIEIPERQRDDEYLKERAILTPRNDDVDEINAYMFKKLAGDSVTYNSADEICKASTDTLDQHNLYPLEFLNTLKFPAIMAHSTFERGGTRGSVYGPEDESNAKSSHAKRCSNFINQDPRDPSKRPLITLDSRGFADTKVSYTITTIFKIMFNGSWTTLKEVNKIFSVGKCDYIMVREVWEDAMKNRYPNIMLKARNVTDLMVHEICKRSDDSISHSKGLARGPLRYDWSYKGYFVNGFKFNTEKYIEGQVRHNNGVCVKGACYNETKCDFYGLLEEVIEVAYRGVRSCVVILFKCKWFDATRGVRFDNKHNIIEIKYKSRLINDEPFVLASQVEQVYYTPYPSMTKYLKDWRVVVKTKSRIMYELEECENEEDGDDNGDGGNSFKRVKH